MIRLQKDTYGRGFNLESVTEDNITLTEPEETLEYVADYFQNLYQAREGEPEYHKSTEEIKVAVEQALRNNNTKAEQGEEPITTKEMNNAPMKEESPGPATQAKYMKE